MSQLRLRWIIALVVAALFTSVGLHRAVGQATNTGTVVGAITDPSGALIPGATVTLADAAAGVTLTDVTNSTGKFIFPTVPPGTYTITATKSGFTVARATGQVVNVGSQLTINMKLKVGGGSETVEVEVTGAELQTLNSTVGQTISQEAIDALPSLNHDVNTFTSMQPAVSPDGSVAGAVNDQNTYLLDGGQITNDMDGSMAVYTGSFAGDPTGVSSANGMLAAGPTGVMPTPQDSVEEVKVNTANQTADFDNSAGSQVEFVTPRGTNRWHGAAYEYYLDNGFDANSWENNQYQIPLTQYHYSRFGAKAGGFILPSMLGGRTYLFGFFEGFRYPQSETIYRVVPTASLEKGTIYGTDGNPYSLAGIDPRGIGINPDVLAMWSKYEPAGNLPGGSCGSIAGPDCDGLNTSAFVANMSLPLSSNDMAFRIDHAFSSKWNWFASYRYYKLTQASGAQTDIGGFFSGDKLGVPAAVATRPQQPWYFVTGLTTSITANLTNDFHYSFLRNYWQWGDNNAPPQVAGLGGAMEPFGETQQNVLAPFTVSTQQIRTRFWDGQDHFLSDNLSLLKGNHLIQFGGQYQHNYNYHQRSDNGGGVNFTPTYQLGDSSGAGVVDMTDLGGGYPVNKNSARVAAAALGIVTDAQVAYTRQGPNLTLNPPLTHAFDQMTIPYYNVYFSDTWHMKPSLTLTYGLGYTLEMPPVEANNKSTVLVDDANEPVVTEDYLRQRKTQAEEGNPYNPILGWSLVNNVGSGSGDKYPYDPFYGSFSPRVGVAWNPSFSKATVVRGGYGRIYGRLNGVDLVLVPLLGDGLMQAVICRDNFSNGTCGSSNPTAATAFRVGVDGNTAPIPQAAKTAPQPIYPGFNQLAGGPAEAMDPHFRPNVIDSFDLTIQRQIGQKSLLEVGYVGRRIQHEYQPIDLNNVPYMFAYGGQQFQNAYAALEKYLGCATSAQACGASVPSSGTAAYTSYISAAPTQPFFEAALKASGYCNGYSSCTAAVMDNELGNLETQSVWNMWSDMDAGNAGAGPGFVFSRTMQNTAIQGQALGGNGQNTSGIAENASVGYGNYNGVFVSFGTRNWHGLTMQHNFTYSKALGTGAFVQASSEYTPNDPYNLGAMYGEQAFDRRIVYNTYIVAQEPWFKGQNGFLGRVAGGWEFAPIFTAGSGPPVYCSTWTNSEGWGGGDGASYFDNEQCVFTSKYNAGHSAHFGVAGDATTGVGTATSATPVNMFKDPNAVWNQVRAPILGIDTKNPGVGPFMGQPYWNMDGQIKKDIRIAESATFEFSFIATNMLNHRQFNDPGLALYSPSTWGVLSSQANGSRSMEFGGRIDF